MDELILPGEEEMRIMNVTFRALPCHMAEKSSSFIITPQALKNMLHLFKSLGMPKLRITLSSDGIDLYTRLGTGLLGLYAWDMVVLYGARWFPGFMIEIPLLKVPIPSDESSTSQIASSSASTSQIGSSSASTSQMTNPDIGSTSEVSGSDSSACRLSKNQRSAIKLAVMMSIFAASGVLMSEVSKLIDKII
nr:hypothetical protein [Tanacetum cinerariifolium]